MGKGDKGQAISSAKAAELLAKGRGQSSGFGGFSGAAPAAPGGFAFGAKYIGQVASVLPPAAAGPSTSSTASDVVKAAIIPADLDGELSQQLQKLSKRDATTKLKALQALKQLVPEKDAADVQQAVPPWAYLYGKLAMDDSRAVRAEASQVMGAFAASLGRSLAPYLKTLVPAWWLAQFDAYGEAGAAARAGLAAAFPAAKQRDVLLFCRVEVLQLLSDNLASTPQTLGDPKKEAAEDLQDRHERVLASTCAAAGALLELLAPPPGAAAAALAGVAAAPAAAAGDGSPDGSVLEGLGALLRQPAFFKGVVQSKAASVRRAGYSLVALVARRSPGLLQECVPEAAPAVLGALADRDPANHPAMWEAILSFGRAYPTGWVALNLQKAFLPRLWSLLRHGCYGSAESSFPAVLPLVTLLPQEVLGPAFFSSLLSNVWSGLEASYDAAGKQAAAECFKECLLYALLKAEALTRSEAAAGAEAGAGPVSTSSSSSEGSGGSSTDAQLSPQVQRYCSEILEAVLPQTVLPAATSAGASAAIAELATSVLAGTTGLAGAAVTAGGKLHLVLKMVGSYLSFATQQALEQAAGAAPEKQEQGVGRGHAAAFERVAALVAALADAAAAHEEVVGELVSRPLMAVLLPEVRAGTAPPAASSLLAALLKRFPQHAAVPAEHEMPAGEATVATQEAPGAEAAAGGAAAEEGGVAPLTGEVSALRLHQSASFTIESVLRRVVGQGESHDQAALAASCDLLLSCLAQVADPGRKFGEALLQLLTPHGNGGSPQVGAALMLVQHLVAGGHAGLSVAGCRSPDVDQAGRLLSAVLVQQPQQRSSQEASLAAAASHGQLADLLTLLLVGDGSQSLLALAAQADVLEDLLSLLGAAAPAELLPAEEELGSEEAEGVDEQALVAALRVVRGAVVAPAAAAARPAAPSAPASGSGSGSREHPAGLVGIQLQLLAAVFRLLAREAVAAARAEPSEDSTVSSEEEEEEELPNPGTSQQAARLAEDIWSQGPQILQLFHSASAAQQAALAAALQSGVLHSITHIAAGSAGPAAAGSAAAATTQLAGLVLLALAGCCGDDQQARQQFLQPLLVPDASGAAERQHYSQYSLAHAQFLVALGQAVGFGLLLAPPQGSAAAAAVAVGALASLAGDGSEGLQLGEPLVQYLVQEAGPSLLSSCLEAALAAAVQAEEQTGAAAHQAGSSSSAPAAAERGAAARAVLCRLLEAAMQAGDSEPHATAAAFFQARIAAAPVGVAAEGQALPLPVLRAVLPVVAPTFRGIQQLLEQSGLPALAVRLCEACDNEANAVAQTQLLSAVSSCFPVPAGPAGRIRPAIAGQVPASTSQPAAAASHNKGDLVWYLDREGAWSPAKVVSVDTSHQPPSYGIELAAGAFRETEAHRLQPRQPGSTVPPPSAGAAAAAAARSSAGGTAGRAPQPAGSGAAFAVLLTNEGERAALLAALERQLSTAGTAAATEPHSSGVAELALRGLTYCWQQLSQRHWGLLLAALSSGLASCCSQMTALAAEVAEAVTQAGSTVAGLDLGAARGAVQFWRQLQQKGVVERSQKAQAAVAAFAAQLQHTLAAAQQQLLPTLYPWLRAYALATVASSRAVMLKQSDWEAAEAAACGDVLQTYVALGALVGVVGVMGPASGSSLAAWLASDGAQAGPAPCAAGDSWQALLSQQVLGTLREADDAYLAAALGRANELEPETGFDAVGSLLSLALSPAAPHCLQDAAYQALLLHPTLLAALSAAEGVSEEDLEQSEVDSGDSVAMLEHVAVRPELVAAVASPSHPALLPAWALLVAHVLAQAPDSHGRRLLVQALKDAHDVVPGVLGALVPLLPLEEKRSARSTPSRGATPASASSAQASSASEPAGAPAPTSAASQFLALGLPEGQQAQQELAVLLYSSLLQALPASARLWFSDLRDRGTAAVVERYTAAAVSGGLLAAEFKAVTDAAAGFGKFDKFSARANATSREVIAVMEVEDGHMLELVVKLPASMPLRAPELECRKRVGVSEGRLRKWLLSISAFLRTQNGSVAEAISLWKQNVDKEFEGQEECLICYSILQPTSGQLPRLGCRTCHKKFHGGCLYKWFKSSGKSNCPHCQSPW